MTYDPACLCLFKQWHQAANLWRDLRSAAQDGGQFRLGSSGWSRLWDLLLLNRSCRLLTGGLRLRLDLAGLWSRMERLFSRKLPGKYFTTLGQTRMKNNHLLNSEDQLRKLPATYKFLSFCVVGKVYKPGSGRCFQRVITQFKCSCRCLLIDLA